MNIYDILNPEHTAILAIDLQNDFLSKGGRYDHIGIDIKPLLKIIKPINALIALAREYDVPIVFSKMIDALKYRNDVGKYFLSKKEKKEECLCVREETVGADFADIKPKPNDTVIIKHNYCSFCGTNLENILIKKKIKTLIIVGVKTNACVESTVRTAYHKNFFIVVPIECVASNNAVEHEASLNNFRRYFADIVKFDQIKTVWKKHSQNMVNENNI